MRIMRRENYLVAMINKDIIDLTVQVPCLGNCTLPFTKSLEWNFHFIVLNWMFSDQFELRRVFMHNPEALVSRFKWFGVLNLCLMPFILPFLVVYFVFKHAEEFQSKRDYLGPRKWSPLALWRFREFNELPHVLERRINGSYEPANMYQRQFPSPTLSALARCVSYVSGALVSVLLLLALVDESLLLHIPLGDKNLLWYTAVFSAALAVSRSLIPEPEDAMFDPEGAMRVLVAYTHYMPNSWRHRCNTYDVRDEFLTLFRFRVELFVQEILGVFLAPYVLIKVMPRSAGKIIDFVSRVTVTVPGVGDVCGYSLFDLKKFGQSNKYGGTHSTSARAGGAAANTSALRCRQGKLEKSIISFYANHRDCGWATDDAGASAVHHLLSNLRQFQMRHAEGGVAHGGPRPDPGFGPGGGGDSLASPPPGWSLGGA